MDYDIKAFLEERNILKDALLRIISKTEALTMDNLHEFCITLTDYLTGSVVKLGLPDDFTFATSFSNTYSKAFTSETKLKKDLSDLIIWLSKRWDNEDRLIAQMQAQPQAVKTEQ